jgi:hypothetical protein
MDKTPETRLLELIKGRGTPRPGSRFRSAGKRIWASAARWRPSVSGLSFWQTSNRALLVVFLCFSAGALRSWFFRPADGPGDEIVAPGTGSREGTPLGSAGASLKDLTRRNLFRSFSPAPAVAPKPIAPAPPPPPPPPKVPLSQRASHFRLTGIIAGDTFQAVIEDKKKNTTRYVSPGDALDDFRVEKVLPDRVVISADGETLDLTL